jgi:hypothetical protein
MKSKKSKLQIALLKRQVELEKASRRLNMDAIARSKRHDSYALCGINYYSVSPHERDRGTYWRTCAHCGKPLQYYVTYEEAQANRRKCHL